MSAPAFKPTDILLPVTGDMTDWSVIACDQFTSEREYWDRVEKRCADKLSTYHMILPEAYLGTVSPLDMAERANAAMRSCLEMDVFETLPSSYVYVERHVTGGVRRGLVGALDLDAYDYSPRSASPVRASERTVADRLPPRMKIRENAPLELPHIMVLIDDPEQSVVEPLHTRTHALRKLYDFDLMEGGGHITGWQVSGEEAARVDSALARLAEKDVQIVIGDGNHSLAAAKELWNRTKARLTPEEAARHPARYALVELNNVYDPGIVFEPIHRVVFGVDTEKLLELMRQKLEIPDGREIEYVIGGEKRGRLRLRGRSFGGMIELLQSFIEEYSAMVGTGEVDYIHDEASLIRLTQEPDTIGFLLPAMDKAELFKTVIADGVFPKKSFSIGHARDKRYYLECRKIK